MGKFILTTDINSAFYFQEAGFQTAGQDGKCWYFVNDKERLNSNKAFFAKKKLKYTTTDKLLFNDFNGVQYIKW